MSKKKARLITCSNIFYNQYLNLYLHKKPLINNSLKLKQSVVYLNSYSSEYNRESLQYSLLPSHNIYLNNKIVMIQINSILPLYLKKFFNKIVYVMNLNFKRNINIQKKKRIYFNFNKIKLQLHNLNPYYKSTSKYYNNRNKNILYNEIQNENKLLNRKLNINKLQLLRRTS